MIPLFQNEPALPPAPQMPTVPSVPVAAALPFGPDRIGRADAATPPDQNPARDFADLLDQREGEDFDPAAATAPATAAIAAPQINHWAFGATGATAPPPEAVSALPGAEPAVQPTPRTVPGNSFAQILPSLIAPTGIEAPVLTQPPAAGPPVAAPPSTAPDPEVPAQTAAAVPQPAPQPIATSQPPSPAPVETGPPLATAAPEQVQLPQGADVFSAPASQTEPGAAAPSGAITAAEHRQPGAFQAKDGLPDPLPQPAPTHSISRSSERRGTIPAFGPGLLEGTRAGAQIQLSGQRMVPLPVLAPTAEPKQRPVLHQRFPGPSANEMAVSQATGGLLHQSGQSCPDSAPADLGADIGEVIRAGVGAATGRSAPAVRVIQVLPGGTFATAPALPTAETGSVTGPQPVTEGQVTADAPRAQHQPALPMPPRVPVVPAQHAAPAAAAANSAPVAGSVGVVPPLLPRGRIDVSAGWVPSQVPRATFPPGTAALAFPVWAGAQAIPPQGPKVGPTQEPASPGFIPSMPLTGAPVAPVVAQGATLRIDLSPALPTPGLHRPAEGPATSAPADGSELRAAPRPSPDAPLAEGQRDHPASTARIAHPPTPEADSRHQPIASQPSAQPFTPAPRSFARPAGYLPFAAAAVSLAELPAPVATQPALLAKPAPLAGGPVPDRPRHISEATTPVSAAGLSGSPLSVPNPLQALVAGQRDLVLKSTGQRHQESGVPLFPDTPAAGPSDQPMPAIAAPGAQPFAEAVEGAADRSDLFDARAPQPQSPATPPPAAQSLVQVPFPSSPQFDRAATAAAPLLSGPVDSPQSGLPVPSLPPVTDSAARVTVRQDAAGRIEVLLAPEELGRVRLEMVTSGEKMQIHLAVERPESLDLLRRHGEQLLQEFRQAGIAGGSLTFGTWGQGEQQQRPPPTAPNAPNTPLPTDPLPSLAAQLRAQPVGSGLNLRL